MKHATVIGSGISGLSISRMLSDRYQVSILEKADKAGGLIKCDRVMGSLFHRVGGHVFNSKNETVLDWFWSHFNREEEFIKATRNAKILFDDQLLGYPLENYLYQLPEEKLRPIIDELLTMVSQVPKAPEEYPNFKAFLIGNFGEQLYNLYFGPYNAKIWNTDISKVPLEWLDGKLPMPQIREVIISNILKKEEASMVHSSFYYPKNNGSQFIIDRLAEQQDIQLSYQVSSIGVGEKGIGINGDELNTQLLVYCGDVRQLAGIVAIEDELLRTCLDAVTNLPSNGTSNVLCETDDTNLSWMYLPEEKYKAHRIIYTGNFSGTNNEPNRRKTCVVEFSGKQDQDDMRSELALLPGNLKPIAFNYEPNSYIIQQKDTRSKIDTLKKHLAKYNIYLLGRFAEWEYYNMDKCIESAMELNKTIR
ncbi:UDP-galactopyranose mutase [Segetibacter sp. 3557_3]|uniref:protoporphyrinogen/coproporphyrinogen oxidase n=1 Tax=Segetibacter sp. 3557_3 TaxID=2547429 RepID=UPI001058F293|nr:NAD(P)-binding protein [Segetibacter sp. 3557_3]TDH20820.1 UDP-galactopyranose mutase [Segetibacter sp. 3557_3]